MQPTVLNVGHHYHVRGGSDRYLLSLEALLKHHQHGVIPYAVAGEQNLATRWSRYFPPGVDVSRPNFFDVLRFLYSRPAKRHLKRLLRDVTIDVAHLHIYYGQLTASVLAPLRQAGIPIIQSLHEYKLTCPVYTHISKGQLCESCAGKYFWRALPRRCNRESLARTLTSVAEAYVSRALGDVSKVDHFIAVSDFLRRKMLQYGVTKPENITTIHNFVDPRHFEVSRVAGDYVLYFGRIASVKGIQTLISATEPLRDVPLYIVGDGEERAELETHVRQHALHHIRFLGFRQGNELYELIRNCICVVLPSEWYENCPMSVLESLASGRPVIGSDIGGIPELIEDGVDGYLVPSGNAEALREKLLWMASHKTRAVEMGHAGRKKIEKKFSPEIHYQQLMDVYERVL